MLITFAITFFLTLLKKVPFGGGRQSMYLFPMVALLMGASIQYCYDWIARFLSEYSNITFVSWMKNHKRLILTLEIACLVASTVFLVTVFKRTDFLRKHHGIHGASNREFPIRQNEYDKLFAYFDNDPRQNDIILTNGKTSYYFLWHNSERKPERLSKTMFKTAYKNIDCFYVKERNFSTEDKFLEAVRELKRHVGETTISTLWVVNLGWKDDVGEKLLSNPAFAHLIVEPLKFRQSFVIGIRGKRLFDDLEHSDASAHMPRSAD
jgi:hypothetical protein